MRRKQRCPRPETEGTAKVHKGDGTEAILRHTPDTLHPSPTGLARFLVLSVDPLDLGILTALALTWPIGWWSA